MTQMNSTAVEVHLEDLLNHPKCPHGPTLLFSRLNDKKKQFYACAACRDRKDCSFFLRKVDLNNFREKKQVFWDKLCSQFVEDQPNHYTLFKKFNKIKQIDSSKRLYCSNCALLLTASEVDSHSEHKLIKNITDKFLKNPSTFLKPKENTKKEAQYLFSTTAINAIVNMFDHLNLRHIICIGAPRIHEYIQDNLIKSGFTSILLDIDERFRHFFGPFEFCWYNLFNNYFFEGKNSKNVFQTFLQSEKGHRIGIIMDPPFGGRIEPIAITLNSITTDYQKLNKTKEELPTFLIFPYFMEQQILNSLSNYKMLDYKIDYDNHCLFTDKGRKNGSPVRFFTNVTPSKIILPVEEGYKLCQICDKWVGAENEHCIKCNGCTSKNGATYKHCDICERCVKPSWRHCDKCNRCAVQDHQCGLEIEFNKNCFSCKQPGHKKRECPNMDQNKSKKKKR